MIQGLVAQARQVFSKMLTCRSLKIITRNMHSISRRWGFHISQSSAILITEQAMVDENHPTPVQQRHLQLVQANQNIDKGDFDWRHQPFQYIWKAWWGMISSYREAHCLRRQLNVAPRTTLQQTSVAYRTRTYLFMRLHQHSTSNLSRTKCHKHCNYPKLHSTHIVA